VKEKTVGLLLLRIDPAAVIPDSDHQPPVIFCGGADANSAIRPVPNGVNGIDDDVEQRISEFLKKRKR
jgi:hypothetical protein